MVIGPAKNLVSALDILRLISERGALTLTEISDLNRIPNPTAHRLLAVLAEANMVRRDGQGRYSLGSQCLVLGSAFLGSLDLRREARSVLEELVEKTGETCYLGIRDGDRVVYIEKVESSHAVQLRGRANRRVTNVSMAGREAV